MSRRRSSSKCVEVRRLTALDLSSQAYVYDMFRMLVGRLERKGKLCRKCRKPKEL